MKLKNDQLEVLWAVAVETGEYDAKYSHKGEQAFLFKLTPHETFVRDVKFPFGSRGAIVIRDKKEMIDGELYDSEENLMKAWKSLKTSDEYFYPPWKKFPSLGMKR